jgi:site-specific recombinase XerD
MATFLASLAKDDLTLGMLRGLRNDLQPFLTWRQSVEQGPFIAKGLAGYDLIAHWQHMVISGRHPATFNRRLDALRRLCRWAHASGSLVTDAARDVRPMRTVRNQQPVGLTHVEVHA